LKASHAHPLNGGKPLADGGVVVGHLGPFLLNDLEGSKKRRVSGCLPQNERRALLRPSGGQHVHKHSSHINPTHAKLHSGKYAHTWSFSRKPLATRWILRAAEICFWRRACATTAQAASETSAPKSPQGKATTHTPSAPRRQLTRPAYGCLQQQQQLCAYLHGGLLHRADLPAGCEAPPK
jgi:hypothetical protein